jgi:hypothetical protein
MLFQVGNYPVVEGQAACINPHIASTLLLPYVVFCKDSHACGSDLGLVSRDS